MTYEEFIDSCKLKNPNPHQKHHIIPLSMGGTNHWSNIIRLSFADHWEAHRLLALKYPDNEEIQKNFRRKGTLEQFIKGCEKLAAQTGPNNSQYGKAPTLGKHWKMSDIARENISHSKIGKTHKGVPHTEETKKKISETQKKRLQNIELRKRISEVHKGNQYRKGATQTEETKMKISQANKGKVAWNKGKQLNYYSKGNKGMHWFTNGRDNILSIDCPEGYRRGRTLCS